MITSTPESQDPRFAPDLRSVRDPRDPLGLAADARLLVARLDWTARAQTGELTPMTTPDRKQCQDLTRAVVACDAPLYGGLDSIKHAVREALAAHPHACGVILGDPSYIGTTGDLTGHARAAHEAEVPLIVDAAWAAYLGFHRDLPVHSMAVGADAMVTSAHKTLPGL